MSSNSNEILIRCVEDTDLGKITGLDEKLAGEYRPDVWERRVSYYFRRDPDGALVAESGGEIVGFMFGEVRSGEFGLERPTGWLEYMAVDPERRGEAIGTRLAQKLMAHFEAKGVETVRTIVDEGTEDIEEFFRALGFVPSPMRVFVKTL